MHLSTVVVPSVRAALDQLIDYAGLFPPAEVTLEAAVQEFSVARSGPHAWMLGRFIVPATLLTRAAPMLGGPLSVLVDPNIDALRQVAVARKQCGGIAALEIPIAKNVSALRDCISRDEILDLCGALETDLVACGLRDLPVFVEVSRAQPWRSMLPQTLDAFVRFGFQAKVRCGGVTAEAFPEVQDLAEFIVEANERKVPFKATAGLHHPIRHYDAATGFVMHGFLNLIAAAALAPHAAAETISEIIAEEDPNAFGFDDTSLRWHDRMMNVDDLVRTRAEGFRAYGSCSFREPVEDLSVLGIIPAQ